MHTILAGHSSGLLRTRRTSEANFNVVAFSTVTIMFSVFILVPCGETLLGVYELTLADTHNHDMNEQLMLSRSLVHVIHDLSCYSLEVCTKTKTDGVTDFFTSSFTSSFIRVSVLYTSIPSLIQIIPSTKGTIHCIRNFSINFNFSPVS